MNDAVDLIEARESGWQRGYEIAKHNTDSVKDGMDLDEAHDAFMSTCSEAEENGRQFSPFEFVAKVFNDADNSEAAWEEFDNGISAGFQAYWDRVILKHHTFTAP